MQYLLFLNFWGRYFLPGEGKLVGMIGWRSYSLGVVGLLGVVVAGSAMAQLSEPTGVQPDGMSESIRPFEEIVIFRAAQGGTARRTQYGGAVVVGRKRD